MVSSCPERFNETVGYTYYIYVFLEVFCLIITLILLLFWVIKYYQLTINDRPNPKISQLFVFYNLLIIVVTTENINYNLTFSSTKSECYFSYICLYFGLGYPYLTLIYIWYIRLDLGFKESSLQISNKFKRYFKNGK